MAGIPPFSAEFGDLPPLSPAQRDNARRNVAAVARDADDCRILLSALGLMEAS